MSNREKAVMVVVCTLACVTLMYMGVLGACAIMHIPIENDILGYMKDVGLVALGALSSLLARTSDGDKPPILPVPTEVVNTPDKPVQVQETK